MNLEIEAKPTTDHCDNKGSQSSAFNEQKLENVQDVEMTDAFEQNGDFEDVEMIDAFIADIDSKDTSGDKKALTVKEEKVTLSEKEEIEKKASTDEEDTEKVASTGIESTEKEASTDRKETEKEESTDRKEAEKEASTDKEEIEKEASKVETKKEASTGRKETEEAFTDKEKIEKDQSTGRKETEKEASTDKEEIEKEASTDEEDTEKVASTGIEGTEKEASTGRKETEKEASTGRKETEEASTSRQETEKEASTHKEEIEKEASTDKEEIEKEASTGKEKIEKKASSGRKETEKEASSGRKETEKEASSNKEAGKESFSGTEASTEKDDTYKKACVEKESLGDKEDTDKETERTENQQTGSSPNGSVDESLDKNNEHLAEHSPPQLNSQSTEDFSTTDSLTGPDPSEEKDDMGACVKKPKHDEESSAANANKNTNRTRSKARSVRYGDRDTEQYRNGYPDQEDDTSYDDNLKFYMGEIKSVPDGDYIDKIHRKWKGDYEKLESHHGYIQWIFPIRENGMNWHAKPLQLHEAEAIKSDPAAHARVLRSYEMMLDFYGMRLKDEKTGTIERADNYVKRFKNLTRNTHNYLRITRILKSLGELGYEHLKKPFLDFILDQALNENTLLHATLSSCENYWIGTIKDDQAREELYQRIEAKKS